MGEIDLTTLYNCTALLLEKVPQYNYSIWSVNRSQVLSVLNSILDDQESVTTSDQKVILRGFLSDCLLPQPHKPHDLLWWQKSFWTVIFAAMLIVATGGNAIVMWIILGELVQ